MKIVLILLLLAVVGSGAYLAGKNQVNLPGFVQSPSQTPNPTANWKTYGNSKLSLKYPPNWNLKTSDYLGSDFQLENSTGSISITVSKGQYPYSIQGYGSNEIETNNLSVKVGEIFYQTQGYILAKQKVYADVTVGEYHILFGTGYPAGNDNLASLSDYQKEKNTILQILSTFKFTD